jgi:hypothetical protein
MRIEGSSVEIQTSAHLNPIGRSMTAPLPVLSSSSIFPPTSSHCARISAKKNFGALSRNANFYFLIFENCVKSAIAEDGECLYTD